MSITMAQMLESVTDAISAMVIFASEAQNNSAVMKNLAAGATVPPPSALYLLPSPASHLIHPRSFFLCTALILQGVASAVQYLVAQAGQTVALWDKLGSAEMAKRMKDNNDELSGAVGALLNACQSVAENPKSALSSPSPLSPPHSLPETLTPRLPFSKRARRS